MKLQATYNILIRVVLLLFNIGATVLNYNAGNYVTCIFLGAFCGVLLTAIIKPNC